MMIIFGYSIEVGILRLLVLSIGIRKKGKLVWNEIELYPSKALPSESRYFVWRTGFWIEPLCTSCNGKSDFLLKYGSREDIINLIKDNT